MTLNSVLGLISSIALFLPVFSILILRLGAYRTFPALLFYYLIVFVYNLFTEGYVQADPGLTRFWGLANNLLDAPLMLTFLIYFSSSATFTRRMQALIFGLLIFEAAIVSIYGFNVKAITIILGPGITILTAFSLFLFIRQTKITISYHKASGKALIAAALLFAYGCYAILYLMYYIFTTRHKADAFLVYFFVVTISSILLTVGILLESKRIRRLHELKVTRRELNRVYAGEKKPIAVPRAAMLDFDRDQWN